MNLDENRSKDLARKVYGARVGASEAIYKDGLISETSRSCPVCFTTAGTEFRLFRWTCCRCDTCGTEYQKILPSEAGLAKYYSLISPLNAEVWKRSREREFKEKLQVMEKFTESNKGMERVRSVELGAGCGSFVAYLKSNGFDSTGVELDDFLVSQAQSHGVNLISGDIESASFELPEADIYLLYEIVEHLSKPRKLLDALFEKMPEGAILIITTPNADGYDNQLIPPSQEGRFIASSLFPPYHINAFSVKSLFYICMCTGFKIEEVSTPGKLDIGVVEYHKGILSRLGVDLDSELAKGWQESLAISNGSGHMQFVLRKVKSRAGFKVRGGVSRQGSGT